jgi:hypothetical protein
MDEYRRKHVPIYVTEEECKKSVSKEYDMYNCLNKTKKEGTKSLQLEVEKQKLPYLDLDFNEENIVKAMVYSEIFGKPKSKRRKR